jgi:hypothetical protein
MKIFPSLLLAIIPVVPLSAGTFPEIDRQVPQQLEVATFGLG